MGDKISAWCRTAASRRVECEHRPAFPLGWSVLAGSYASRVGRAAAYGTSSVGNVTSLLISAPVFARGLYLFPDNIRDSSPDQLTPMPAYETTASCKVIFAGHNPGCEQHQVSCEVSRPLFRWWANGGGRQLRAQRWRPIRRLTATSPSFEHHCRHNLRPPQLAFAVVLVPPMPAFTAARGVHAWCDSN